MGCNSSKKKENAAVQRHWDAEQGGAGRGGSNGNNGTGREGAGNGNNNAGGRPQMQHSASRPVGIGGGAAGGAGDGEAQQQQQQQPVFEDEFILSTSTHNRLKEHELMNAIITRSAAEFVDVNQASDMLDDDDPFEVSREFSQQVHEARVREADVMPPPALPSQAAGVRLPRDVVDVLATRSVTTQERSEIGNIAYQLTDAVSQVAPQDRGEDMVVKFEV